MLRYSSTTSAITFQQFVNVMSGRRTASFTCAVHWRDRQVRSGLDWHMAPAPSCLGTLNSMVSQVGFGLIDKVCLEFTSLEAMFP